METRRRAGAFVRGLLADLPRKNCWTIAEHAGDATPGGMQLSWPGPRDADAVRDDLRGYVTAHLSDPQAVLVVDETGDLKKGRPQPGCSGSTPGPPGGSRTRRSRSISVRRPRRPRIDRPGAYLPASWARDRAGAAQPGSRQRGVRDQLPGPPLTPGPWMRASRRLGSRRRSYGADPQCAQTWRTAGRATSWLWPAITASPPSRPRRADDLAACPPRRVAAVPAGPGAKGHRYYDWALIAISAPRAGQHTLLIRRSRRTRELAFYRCYAPAPVPLQTLVTVAGRRWTVEENPGGTPPARPAPGPPLGPWYRWVTLAMLAAAFLTITAARQAQGPQQPGQIPLTRTKSAACSPPDSSRPDRTASCAVRLAPPPPAPCSSHSTGRARTEITHGLGRHREISTRGLGQHGAPTTREGDRPGRLHARIHRLREPGRSSDLRLF